MKTPLIERMEKKGAPNAWIAEVRAMMNEIEDLKETAQAYLGVIDALAREKEGLEKRFDAACRLLKLYGLLEDNDD